EGDFRTEIDRAVRGPDRWAQANRRRPAWEIGCRLQIESLASTASTDGDRITPSFNDLLQSSRKRSKNGAKNPRNNSAGFVATARRHAPFQSLSPGAMVRPHF